MLHCFCIWVRSDPHASGKIIAARLGCNERPYKRAARHEPLAMMRDEICYNGIFGRDERIRTSDPHTPSVMRYQAALRPDRKVRQ